MFIKRLPKPEQLENYIASLVPATYYYSRKKLDLHVTKVEFSRFYHRFNLFCVIVTLTNRGAEVQMDKMFVVKEKQINLREE